MDWRVIGGLLAAYAAALLVYHPFANLTYGGDDFAYAWSAERLVLDGKLVASSWVAAAAVPQLFWAYPFCKLFGFSYRMLNISTMLFGAFAPVLVYCIALELGIARRYAALVAFFAIITPYLGFSSSFMSDTYYEVFLLGAALLYARGLRWQHLGYLLAGSVVAGVGLLQRQIGIATPAAVVGTLVIAVLLKRRRFLQGAMQAVAAALLPALVAAVFKLYPHAFGGITATQVVKLNGDAFRERLADHWATFNASYTVLVYLGAFTVPLVVACLPAFRNGLKVLDSWLTRGFAALLVVISLTGLWYAADDKLRLQVPGEFMHTQSLTPMAMPVWYGLVAVGSLALPLLAAAFLVRTKRLLPRTAAAPVEGSGSSPSANDAVLTHLFLALALAAHACLVVTFIAFFNNYFLPLLPLTMLLAGTLLPAPRPALAGYRQWLLPSVAGLFAFTWSTLNLDAMFRYVEADHAYTERLLADGRRSYKLFNYMGGFARRNYERSDIAINKNPRKAFNKIRNRARYVVISTGNAHGPFTTLLETEPYRTLTGTKTLELRERNRRKVLQRKKLLLRRRKLRQLQAREAAAAQEPEAPEAASGGGSGPD